MKKESLKELTFAGFLVSIGIVFGDIGTSPPYTFKAILEDKPVTELIALGGVSAIFRTLFFRTTLECAVITPGAGNEGRTGIFSLFTLGRLYRNDNF